MVCIFWWPADQTNKWSWVPLLHGFFLFLLTNQGNNLCGFFLFLLVIQPNKQSPWLLSVIGQLIKWMMPTASFCFWLTNQMIVGTLLCLIVLCGWQNKWTIHHCHPLPQLLSVFGLQAKQTIVATLLCLFVFVADWLIKWSLPPLSSILLLSFWANWPKEGTIVATPPPWLLSVFGQPTKWTSLCSFFLFLANWPNLQLLAPSLASLLLSFYGQPTKQAIVSNLSFAACFFFWQTEWTNNIWHPLLHVLIIGCQPTGTLSSIAGFFFWFLSEWMNNHSWHPLLCNLHILFWPAQQAIVGTLSSTWLLLVTNQLDEL